MRRFILLFSALVLGALSTKAQTVADFESLSLVGTDTAYINYSAPGTDVGFNNGLAHFPCVYDTGFGSSFWSSGFAYSNSTDSITSGFMNQYSAKAAIGYNGSAKYVVAFVSNPVTFANVINMQLTGVAVGQPVSGFYITNNTYAYNSMHDGDGFAKKFGDTTGTGITTGQGTAPDWFKLKVKGFAAGTLKPDSVEFYLADFRPAGTANDSIIRSWHWVDLLPLGHVDSLQFSLSSSDANSFGMKTPAYFCMDNFTTHESSVGINNVSTVAAKVYPNPASEILNIDLSDSNFKEVAVMDITGRTLSTQLITAAHIEINTSSLPAGAYMLKLSGTDNAASVRFIKK